MNTIYFLILMGLVTFSSCINKEEKEKTSTQNGLVKTDTSDKQSHLGSTEHYDYDTLLKGKYTLLFEVDDSTENLYLKKDKIIKKVASCSKGLPYKNLGYKVADFNDYFVLAHSFGSGNPQYIELIKKTSGENILDNTATWVGADESRELLLYCSNDASTTKNKIILFDIKNKHKDFFGLPNNGFDKSIMLNDIHIDSVTDKYLVIKYSTEGGVKTKMYERGR